MSDERTQQMLEIIRRMTLEEREEEEEEEEEEEDYYFLGSSIKEGILMEFRLYDSKEAAMNAAAQISNGEEPIHHPPHKSGDRYHYHVSGHTLDTDTEPRNIHFMYGDRIYEIDFEPDSDETDFESDSDEAYD